MYKVIKRDGQVVEFDIKKIANAITKAFTAKRGSTARASSTSSRSK